MYVVTFANLPHFYPSAQAVPIVDLRDFHVIFFGKLKNIAYKTLFISIAVLAVFVMSVAIVFAAQAKMSANVQGWYEVKRINNETLDIKTNMKTILNGKPISVN